MAGSYIKKSNGSLEYRDDTGKVKLFHSSIAVDRETWFKLYVMAFSDLTDNLSGNAVKVFIKCLLYAQEDMGDGNFFTINKYLKAEFEKIKVLSNLNMYLNELIENNCIYRIARGVYGINSLIAYCGALHNDANLSVKIFTRLDAEAKNNQPQQ